MTALMMALYCCLSSYLPAYLYKFSIFSKHLCSYRALLLNSFPTPMMNICYLSCYTLNAPFRVTYLCSNDPIERKVSTTLVKALDLAHSSARTVLLSVLKQR